MWKIFSNLCISTAKVAVIGDLDSKEVYMQMNRCLSLFPALIAILCFTQGCGSDMAHIITPVNAPGEQSVSYGLVLSLGASSTLIDSQTEVSFSAVTDDSRCPLGAVCVWQGRVAVELQIIEPDMEPQTVNLGLGEGLNSSYELGYMTIELQEVLPVPSIKTGPLHEYKIRLDFTINK